MKNKLYLILYYTSFVLTIGTTLFFNKYYDYKNYIVDNYHSLVGCLKAINIILVIVFTILLIFRKKITKSSLLFPISYLVFFLVIALIAYYYHSIVGEGFMDYFYFIFFIFIDYLLLNIYSLISLLKS